MKTNKRSLMLQRPVSQAWYAATVQRISSALSVAGLSSYTSEAISYLDKRITGRQASRLPEDSIMRLISALIEPEIVKALERSARARRPRGPRRKAQSRERSPRTAHVQADPGHDATLPCGRTAIPEDAPSEAAAPAAPLLNRRQRRFLEMERRRAARKAPHT